MKKIIILAVLLSLFLVAIVIVQPVFSAPPIPPMQDLGTLGGDTSGAYAINYQGQIVGTADTTSGDNHAFLWENGTMTDLGTLGGDKSVAYDINDKGQVVGYSKTALGEYHACLWENGRKSDIGIGEYSIAKGINNSGIIVGYYLSSSSQFRAFLLKNGTRIDLGTLGGDWSIAEEINDSGQVVGVSKDSSGYQKAFLWENDVMIELITLGGNYGYAHGINNSGQIVGRSSLPPVQGKVYINPCLWENDTITDLGTLYSSGAKTYASAINEYKQVVGQTPTLISSYRAFLWTEKYGMQEIGTLGGNISSAFDINDMGQVVGFSTIAGGQKHAFFCQVGTLGLPPIDPGKPVDPGPPFPVPPITPGKP